jgi:hypothetical protein
MSGVALRCANCGTTQSHPGECEACFHGEVRYFCSNHSPGLWLDGPVCRRCGAEFGDAPRREPEPPAHSTPARNAPEAPPVESRPPGSGGAGRRLARPSRSPVSGGGSEDIPTPPSLADLLGAIAGRTRARHKPEDVWTPSPPERTSRGLPVVGCLVRLVLFIIFLIVLVIGGWLMLLTGGLS